MDPSFLREKQAREVRANRVKLGLMVVLLLGVIYGMFELSRSRTPPQEAGARKAVQEQPAGERPLSGMDLARGGKSPDTIALTPEELQAATYLTDPGTLGQIEHRESTAVERGPFFHMLYHVAKEPQETLEAQALTDVTWQQLWDDGAAYCNKPVRMSGKLVRMREQPLGTNPMKLTKLFVYRIRVEGVPFYQSDHLCDVYAIEKLAGALAQDEVTFYGRFFKPLIIEPEGRIDDPDLHVAVLIARRLEPLTYLDEPTVPEPVVVGNLPEARAVYYLLRRARQTPFDQLRQDAAERTYVDLTTEPEAYRGQPVVVRGELRRLVRMPLGDNPLGIGHLYHGQVVDADRKMNTFYCLAVPEGIHLKDTVVVYGYFLKPWTYVSEGKSHVTSTVLVGSRLLVMTYAKTHTGEILFGVVIAITAIVILVAIVRERARRLAGDEARRQRQMKRVPPNLNEIARQRSSVHPKPGEPAPQEPPPDEQG